MVTKRASYTFLANNAGGGLRVAASPECLPGAGASFALARLLACTCCRYRSCRVSF